MGAASIEQERLNPASLLYIDPAWPVVWSFAGVDPDDDWQNYHGKSPFPTLKGAKLAADIGCAENQFHIFVVQSGAVVYEVHP